jgi:DNA-binding winged helix-turn-helix (wHTH) protein
VRSVEPIAAERVISFGPFSLLPARRLLLECDKPVRIGSRAFEILTFLAEHPGEVLDKDALIARAWPGTFVEESNLKFQVSALRRTLGEGNRYLATIPGRGYSFVAPVKLTKEVPTAPPRTATARVHPNNLPAQLTRLIGRADIVDKLIAQLPRQRLLTIVGPGGVVGHDLPYSSAEGSGRYVPRSGRSMRPIWMSQKRR